jgi:hypothetical protein
MIQKRLFLRMPEKHGKNHFVEIVAQKDLIEAKQVSQIPLYLVELIQNLFEIVS